MSDNFLFQSFCSHTTLHQSLNIIGLDSVSNVLMSRFFPALFFYTFSDIYCFLLTRTTGDTQHICLGSTLSYRNNAFGFCGSSKLYVNNAALLYDLSQLSGFLLCVGRVSANLLSSQSCIVDSRHLN